MDFLRPLSNISFGGSPRAQAFPSFGGAVDELEPQGKRPRNKIPLSLRTWFVLTTIISMLVIGVGIEVALLLSNKLHGFSTGDMTTETVQWLSAFIPTLAIGPIVWVWKKVDRDFKKLQPYVNMSQRPTTAKESVLLNLEHGSLYDTTKMALKTGHYLIIASSALVVVNIFIHPMAGSFFLVRPGQTTIPSQNVRSISALGLDPSYKDITSFVAAAGFAEAAAFHNLSDPPFIKGGWAVAQFKFPLDVTRNSTITATTPGVLTDPQCTSVPTTLTRPSGTSNNSTLSASPGPECQVSQQIDTTAATSQYGVEALTNCTLNGQPVQNELSFAPSFFWFYTVSRNGPASQAVVCAPTISAHQVKATVDGTTGLLVSVNATSDIQPSTNNVTGGSLAGKAFNGISFATSDFNLTDPFVLARALAVESGVPGAIFRFASDSNSVPGGLDAVFANATGFLGLTEKIYTQYLSIVALSNYFITANVPIEADLTLWPERLWINPRNAHSLAGLLISVAIIGGILHLIHRRQRKNLYLASQPGSVAHYMSILSEAQRASDRSQEPDVGNVGPFDDNKAMRKKLDGMRFMIDPHGGGVVALLPGETAPRPAKRERDRASKVSAYEMEDPRKSLLGSAAERSKTEPYDPYHDAGGAGHSPL
ncbi:hypothetical protein BU17DRAFT_78609 [Hysterangium stoloniferum]|nr:hypothetical protein BU17DRAFT_78609 [Hysterangium stoloniferum]